MFDAQVRYLATAFVDAESVRPNSEDIAKFISEFNFAEFVSVAVQEPSLAGQSRRIGFVSSDGSWQIFLLGQRFNVARLSSDPTGGDLGDFTEFCQTANKTLQFVLRHFGRRSHRLAAVQEGVMKNKSEEEIRAIAEKLLKLPEIFKKNPLSEWDWRCVGRTKHDVGGIEESFNEIVTIKRINVLKTESTEISIGVGTLPLTQVPSMTPLIRLDLDINTTPENTSARFQDERMDDFFEKVITWHNELKNQISHLIDVA